MHWRYLCIASLLGISLPYTSTDIDIKFPKNCYGVEVIAKRSITLDKYPYNVCRCGNLYKGSKMSKSTILNYILKILGTKSDRDKLFPDILHDTDAYIVIMFTIGNRKSRETVTINISDILNKDFTNFWTKKFLSTVNVSRNIPYSSKNGCIRYSNDNIYCVNVLSKHIDNKKLSKYIDLYIKHHEKYNDEQTYYLLNTKFVDYIDKQHFSKRDTGNPFYLIRSKSMSNKKINKLLEERREKDNDIKLHEIHSKILRKTHYNGDDIDRIIDQSNNIYHYDTTLDTSDMTSLFLTYSNLYYIRNREDIFKRLFILFVLIMKRIDNNYWIKEKDNCSYFATSCKLLEALSIT